MVVPNASATEGSGSIEPIQIVAQRVQRGIYIEVLGTSEGAYEATFTLETSTDGNHSTHRGSAKLEGGVTVILSAVMLGAAEAQPWRARLLVEPRGGAPYELLQTGP